MLVIDSYSDQYLFQRNDGVTVMKSKIEVLKEAMEMCIAKRGIENVVAMVNQVWIDNGEAYPLPYGEYHRYAVLLADLERMLVQVLEARFHMFFGANDYTARRAIIEAAHTEALQINNRITQDTHQYAAQLNLVLDEVEVQGMNVVLVCCGHKEPLFALFRNADGSFNWNQNVCLPQNIKEELPAYYPDESYLRDMLEYIAKELKYEIDNI